jgi:cyclic pyranopterin phosphate synthase
LTSLVQIADPDPLAYASLGPRAPESGPLTDTFGRLHSDLRISVTDRCNIRCFYCMPASGAEFAPASHLLRFPEILRFVSVAVPLGIDKIRLTGGEPLLRPRLAELIAPITQMRGVRDVALTTNGVLLAEHAKPLHDAGLRRLNIHLDTLDRERFRTISRRDDLPRVLRGIDAALDAGYDVIKINAVAIKGLTEPDVIPLVRFGRERGIEIRFIEFMPLDAQSIWSLDRVLTADAIIELLESEFGPLAAVPGADPRAPATEYQFEDGFKVGFIASISRPFCMNCNRLRLTSDGKLRYCLFANEETSVRHLLTPATQQALTQAIRQTVWDKWIGHQIHQSAFQAPQRPMYSIGG